MIRLKSLRITLSTLGTLGDVLPFAQLARALAAAGHQVTVHAWEQYRAPLATPTVRFVPAAGDVSAPALAAALAEGLAAETPEEQAERFARLFYVEPGAAYYRRIHDTLAATELAVFNVLDHLGQAAATARGIPWVAWHSRPPLGGTRSDGDDALLGRLDRRLSAFVSRLSGQPPQALRIFRQRSPLLDLVAASPHLTAADELPTDGGRVVLTGHWLGKEVLTPLPESIAEFIRHGRRPILLATFGTLPDLDERTAKVRAACRAAGVRLILQDLQHPPEEDRDCLIVAERLPYAPLLAQVDGVLHHGGAGTTHEICRAGRPSFCVPHMGDQYYWAQRLSERGLGPAYLPHTELAIAPLCERIVRLLYEPRYRQRAAPLRAMAEEDGVATAVELLGRLRPSS